MRNDIAIQTYSLRNIIEEKGNVASLELVSKLGFPAVELYRGTCDRSAEELKDLLDKFNLKAVSNHVLFDALKNDLNAQIVYNRTVGNQTIVCPHTAPADLEATKNTAKVLKAIQDELVKEGFRFGYHNHAHEMVKIDGDKRIIDIYADEGVLLQPDLHWVKVGGYDPIEFINQYCDRIVSLHFKEWGVGDTNPEIGNGDLDWNAIMAAGEKSTATHYILEQEQYTMPVEDSITVCAENLHKMFK